MEPKWFGGILGGHVGIENGHNKILNFVPHGDFHWVAKHDDRHSHYLVHSHHDFYTTLGSKPDSVKKAIISIPVSADQRRKFDSISTAYLQQTPYDYAFLGMRCGAASYEILGQLGIVPAYSLHRTYKKIFYPKKLRKRLLKDALKLSWTIERQEGTNRRKWEKD